MVHKEMQQCLKVWWDVLANFVLSLAVKEFYKSINISQNY